jgi:hypothetical protein
MSTKSLREATVEKDRLVRAALQWNQLDLAVTAALVTGRAVGDCVDVSGQDAGNQDRPGRPVKQPAADELHLGPTLGAIEDKVAANMLTSRVNLPSALAQYPT